MRGVYFLDYYTNRLAYAKDCVNKARPQLHCDGKCQLMQKIKAQEKKEQENQEKKAELKVSLLVLSSRSFYHTGDLQTTCNITGEYAVFQVAATVDQPSSFFHPPAV